MGRRTKARRAIPPALALQSQRRRRRAKAGIAVTVTRRRAGLEAGKRTAAVAKVAIEIARSGVGVAIVTRKTGTRVGAAIETRKIGAGVATVTEGIAETRIAIGRAEIVTEVAIRKARTMIEAEAVASIPKRAIGVGAAIRRKAKTESPRRPLIAIRKRSAKVKRRRRRNRTAAVIQK